MADYDGGEVVVTNKTGTFRFRYKTEDRPIGITTDSQAQLIVPYTCMRDVRINIIDRNGRFLHLLNIFQYWNKEVGLDVDSEDNLYLAEVNGTVKKIRYMKQLNE